MPAMNAAANPANPNVSIDIYNALNRNPGTSYNQTFGANYLVPNAILQARFAKFSMHIDW